jgi:hypothetical protein
VTATEVETGLEILEALDFEPDESCEIRVSGCDGAPMWWAVNTCCGAMVRCCGPCRPRMLAWLATHMFVGCAVCGKVRPTDPLPVRFEPIKGGK